MLQILPPNPRSLLPTLLLSLPTSTLTSQPPSALLPLLTPILRQRLQFLSSSSSDKEPWLPLLTYTSQTPSATTLASVLNTHADSLSPHPVSGEIEVDWDSEVHTTYKRIDEESLLAYIALREFEILVKALYCPDDSSSGADAQGTSKPPNGNTNGSATDINRGWRISEVLVLEDGAENNTSSFPSIDDAEKAFSEAKSGAGKNAVPTSNGNRSDTGNSWQHTVNGVAKETEDSDDDDDAYWAQYDTTPARTPAVKRSPAPAEMARSWNKDDRKGSSTAEEDAYFAQYASVQPAMEAHDPDEAAAVKNAGVDSTLDGHGQEYQNRAFGDHRAWGGSENGEDDEEGRVELNEYKAARHRELGGPSIAPDVIPGYGSSQNGFEHNRDTKEDNNENLVHPRPTSSNSSSNGRPGSQGSSRAVETLERKAAAAAEKSDGDGTAAADGGSAEEGVRQHIARTVRGLFLLGRSVGMGREEFEGVVRREMDVLVMLDEGGDL